jgi:hypothetical protein
MDAGHDNALCPHQDPHGNRVRTVRPDDAVVKPKDLVGIGKLASHDLLEFDR